MTRFSKSRFFLLTIIIVVSTSVFILNGSRNTPISNQAEFPEVDLVDDPSDNPLFDFNFKLPEINIPILTEVFGLAGSAIWVVIFIILIMVLLLISSLIISRVRRGKRNDRERKRGSPRLDQKEMKIRRIRLGQRIEEIILFLKSCLDGQYSQGITLGFERLDEALKEYSKISRPGWITPREFSRLKIPYFNHEAMINAVEKFYRITYGQKEANQKDLEDFIYYLEIAIADQKVLKWYSDVPFKRKSEE